MYNVNVNVLFFILMVFNSTFQVLLLKKMWPWKNDTLEGENRVDERTR